MSTYNGAVGGYGYRVSPEEALRLSEAMGLFSEDLFNPDRKGLKIPDGFVCDTFGVFKVSLGFLILFPDEIVERVMDGLDEPPDSKVIPTWADSVGLVLDSDLPRIIVEVDPSKEL